MWELSFPTKGNTLSLEEILLGSYYTLLGSQRTLGIWLVAVWGRLFVLAVLLKLAKVREGGPESCLWKEMPLCLQGCLEGSRQVNRLLERGPGYS